jgi:endonuclease-8
LATPVDYGQIQIRARVIHDDHAKILDVLLDQRVACGIGNVYKSEVLFIERCHPHRSLGQISDTGLSALYRCASTLLKKNLHGGPRITRFVNDNANNYWVYGRNGQSCLQCTTTILTARLGKDLRSTYWCPSCQSAPDD